MSLFENKRVQTALVALLAYAVVAYIQRKVKVIPLAGDYLPK